MAKGYWIARFDILDEAQFKIYAAVGPEVVKNFGGKFLVRLGNFETPEGEAKSRNLVVEFPSYQIALDVWKSDEYQQAMALRKGATNIDLVIIEGYMESPVG